MVARALLLICILPQVIGRGVVGKVTKVLSTLR